MKPVNCIVSSNFCECNKQHLYTADQLRQAKAEVLREAARRIGYADRATLYAMADEIERSKT